MVRKQSLLTVNKRNLRTIEVNMAGGLANDVGLLLEDKESHNSVC